jgi:hypothetical protein
MREQEKMVVRIRTRGSTRGDLFHLIYPGKTWQGWSYDELWNLGVGNHEVEVPRAEH